MKAVVFHGVGDIRLDDVREPKLKDATDAIVRLTTSAICGTDLHMVRGTMSDMEVGTILGHEGVGIIEKLGDDVRNFKEGDRVLIASTIACGTCVYCRAGYYAQCDSANPNGPAAGTAFFGGPKGSGPFQGLQAEKARIPFASVGLVKLPDDIRDDQAILMSDIFPTAYFAVEMANIHAGCCVAVFGCGPVGQFVIASLKLAGAGRIFAIDSEPSRLDMARAQGAEVINFDEEDPVETLMRLTCNIGVDRAIDAVGVDAEHAHSGPAAKKAKKLKTDFAQERHEIVKKPHPDGDNWQPGDAPSQALNWAIEGLAKAGTLSIVGVYPDSDRFFPIGKAMRKNLTIRMGNCNHRKYIPKLIELVRSKMIDPSEILTQEEPLDDAIEAYKAFDLRKSNWVKVALHPKPE